MKVRSICPQGHKFVSTSFRDAEPSMFGDGGLVPTTASRNRASAWIASLEMACVRVGRCGAVVLAHRRVM